MTDQKDGERFETVREHVRAAPNPVTGPANTPFSRAGSTTPASLDTLTATDGPTAPHMPPVSFSDPGALPKPPESELGPGWQTVALPSNGNAGYPAVIYARRFGMPDLARLSVARASKSFIHLANALGATMNFDIAKLTMGDLLFYMQWQLRYSYPTMPFTVTWTSRYGKQNTIDANNEIQLDIITLKPTDEFVTMHDAGFDFRRVGAEMWLESHEEELTDEQRTIFNVACSYAGPGVDVFDIAARIANVNSLNDLDVYTKLATWDRVSDHGVVTTAKLRCRHFDPLTALDDLANSLLNVQSLGDMVSYDDETSTYVRSIVNEMANLRRLADEDKLSEAVAVEEDITIPLDIHMFFPYAI